jgi:hypothetical protein
MMPPMGPAEASELVELLNAPQASVRLEALRRLSPPRPPDASDVNNHIHTT